MSGSRRRGSSTYQALQKARDALARAKSGAAKADPWRVQELQLRYDEALARALDAGADVDGPAPDAPAPHGPAPRLPLAWLDESVSAAARRGEGGS